MGLSIAVSYNVQRSVQVIKRNRFSWWRWGRGPWT